MNAQSNRSGKRNLNIWYPRDFNHFISITGYIKDKIDPISKKPQKRAARGRINLYILLDD